MLKWFRKIIGGPDDQPAEPVVQPDQKPNADFEPLDPTLAGMTGDAVDPALSPQFIGKEEAPPPGFPNHQPIPPHVPRLDRDASAETVAEPFDSEDQMIDAEKVAPPEPSKEPEEKRAGIFRASQGAAEQNDRHARLGGQVGHHPPPRATRTARTDRGDPAASDVGVTTTQKTSARCAPPRARTT